MVWRYGQEGATHKIWPGSMQRFPRNLSLQTTDGWTDALPLHGSSSDLQWHKAELKIISV